jgi:ABC-2 type transport system permease protein
MTHVVLSRTYLHLELRRVVRKPQLLAMTVGLPVVMFLVFTGIYAGGSFGGISSAAYTMVNMAAYGALAAGMFSAAGIALERKIGWNRQLRLTPLPPLAYVVAKGLTAWLVTLPALLLVYLAGAGVGVRLPALRWVELVGVSWVSLVPFVLLGIALGYLGTSETIGVVTTFLMLGLSLLGGLWIPVEVLPDAMAVLAQGLPSYWLAAAGRSVLGAPGFSWVGAGVLVAWTAGLGALAANRYLADTRRA